MRQRLDITDVEAQTKIRAKYLRALENEDFGMLPGPTFVKSFLRTYAEFLGLDPHLLVEEYRARHDPRDESELTPFARPTRGGSRRRPPRRPTWLPLAAAVLAILVVLLVLGLTGNSSNDPSSSATTTTTTTTKKKRATSKPPPKPAAKPRSVRLRIVPAGPTYVCLDKGPGTPVVYEATLTGPKSWRARPPRRHPWRPPPPVPGDGKHEEVAPRPPPNGFLLWPA